MMRSGSAIPAARSAIDPMSLVDPTLRPELVKLLPQLEKEVYTQDTLDDMRSLADKWSEAPTATPHVSMRKIPGSPGNPSVNVYLVNHEASQRRPAILHIHGGGYIVGSAIGAVRRLQKIARNHNCLIVTVDYRLAPESKFPASLEDNYAALRWLYEQADVLHVDRSRIAVMGESAGGGHAAALAIAVRDRGEFQLCLQALIYPMLDDRTGSSRQPPPWIGTFIWKRQANVFGWTSLLGVPAGSNAVPHGAVPARIESLEGLPAAFIAVGSIDLFVEEDIEYARRLVDCGVSTELYVVAGGYHGFNEIAPAAPVSVQFEKVLNDALERSFR